MTSQDQPGDQPDVRSADPLIGRIFNERFKIQGLLARGGLSAVYRAEQAPLGRTCALKVLKPRYEGSIQFEFHRRFFLEASVASKLTHPNNVTVFDYGHTEDDVYFMAMEYLEGRTLAQTIKAEAPFTEERILHIARQVCRALREAHSLGVIHRDIKPSNIFLVERADEDDFVKVIDYGLVKDLGATDGAEELTQAGLFMGSPKYVSPEQIQGDMVDGRADIYSLGIILYEMATGHVPFERNSDVHTLIAHVKEDPPPLRAVCPSCNVSPALELLIYKCIAKRAVDRFASTEELLHLLKAGGDPAATATLMSESGRILSLRSSGRTPIESRSGTVSGPHVFLAGGATGPSTPMDPSLVERANVRSLRAQRMRHLIAAGLAVSAIGATALIVGLRSRTLVQPVSNAASAAIEPAASIPAAVPVAESVPSLSTSPPVAQVHRVRLDTDPSGASVQLDGPRGDELCASTPCEIILGQGPLGDTIQVYVSRKGFVSLSREVASDDESLSLRLVPLGNVAVKKTVPTSSGPTNDWYRIDPY